jgi:hypothetical protein
VLLIRREPRPDPLPRDELLDLAMLSPEPLLPVMAVNQNSP